jgi:hypothetical protein
MAGSTYRAGYVLHFDPGTIPSIERRIYPLFRAHLILTLHTVVESIIATVKSSLQPLQEGHIPYDNVMGGFDTGRMRDSITAFLVESIETGVYYDLNAGDVAYWKWVNFGHFVKTANGAKWWEGYHYFEKAIKAHEGAVFKAAQLAWHQAAIESSAGAALGAASGISADLLAALSASEQG